MEHASLSSRLREIATFALEHPTDMALETIAVISQRANVHPSALILASGDAKAEAVKAAIEGPVSSMCPASALQMHAAATVVIDDAAASMLQLKDYFLEVQQEQRRLDSQHASPAR